MANPVVSSPDEDDETPIGETDDAAIVREGKKRFHRCAEWNSIAHIRMLEDIKFANGDSRNMYQWDAGELTARGFDSGTGDAASARPCLTINKTHQHNLQIINDGRQNKTSIRIKPVGDESTYESAQIEEGLVRHIEYQSNAQACYTIASTFQVEGGIGYCRVVTDYADDETFNQEIYIRAVPDPLNVYLDPDATEADGSDARYGFIFADISREQFKDQYPEAAERLPRSGAKSTLGNDEYGWIAEHTVRVAEYYYRTRKHDELVVFANPIDGTTTTVKRSEMEGMTGALRAAFDECLKDPATKRRPLIGHEVKWVKIAGDEIVDRKDWPGDTVPIAFCVGKVTVIDGILDRKGHTRAMIDPQRTYNYMASANVETVSLQTKTPYMAPSAAIEGLETFWGRNNLDNLAVLPWKHIGDDGNPIPKPERTEPPMGSMGYQQGMQNAATDMMLVSGQYQPMMGEPSNERSGKAIQARQRQGENATYHFIDSQAMMIRRLGKIIIDLIPKIYDTPRIVKIIGEDGSDSDVMIDPDAKQAHEERKAQTEAAAAQVVFNPRVGKYDVMSDVGPDFATRRQEAFNALSQIAAQNPELMAIIGDLVMLAADFPLADEAAERLRRMVPKQALGDEGPDPQVAALTAQLQSTQTLMASMSQKLMAAQSKAVATNDQKAIDIYKAFTDRLDVFLKYTQVPQADIAAMQHELAVQEHAGNLDLTATVVDNMLSSNADDTAQAA